MRRTRRACRSNHPTTPCIPPMYLSSFGSGVKNLQEVERFVSSSLLGPVVPSFGALSGRLKFTVRHLKFNKDYLPLCREVGHGNSDNLIKTPSTWERGRDLFGQILRPNRLVFYCRTTSASTAPRTPRRRRLSRPSRMNETELERRRGSRSADSM